MHFNIYIYIGTLFTCRYILELFSHDLFIGIWKWFYFTCIYILELFSHDLIIGIWKWFYFWIDVFSPKLDIRTWAFKKLRGLLDFFILPMKPVSDLFLKLESISWKNNQSRIWLNVSEELKVLHLNWLWATHKVFDRIP